MELFNNPAFKTDLLMQTAHIGVLSVLGTNDKLLLKLIRETMPLQIVHLMAIAKKFNYSRSQIKRAYENVKNRSADIPPYATLPFADPVTLYALQRRGILNVIKSLTINDAETLLARAPLSRDPTGCAFEPEMLPRRSEEETTAFIKKLMDMINEPREDNKKHEVQTSTTVATSVQTSTGKMLASLEQGKGTDKSTTLPVGDQRVSQTYSDKTPFRGVRFHLSAPSDLGLEPPRGVRFRIFLTHQILR